MKHILSLSIIILMTFIGCQREEETFEVPKCSELNYYGACDAPTDICYKGKCIAKTAKCGGSIDAPCENYDECKRNDVTREFECVEGRCSKGNTDGYCITEGETCYHGYCKTPCSNEVKNGGCESANDKCFDGACLDKKNLCSNSKPLGLCAPENRCAKNSDGNFVCLEKCHKVETVVEGEEIDYSKMPCDTENEVCILGECLHADNLCTDSNVVNGECPSHQTCVANECKDICSENYTDGVCLADNQVCSNGSCVFQCDTNHPAGYCSKETYGENGGCEAGVCKKVCGTADVEGSALDGYCEGVNWCKDGECVVPCDINHPDGICEDVSDYCANGVCKKRACSEQFPDGYCPLSSNNLEQRCVNHTCVEPCSVSAPNGWCNNDQFCYENVCRAPNQIPCNIDVGSKCTNSDEECVNNVCLLKPCQVDFNGRCEQAGEVCHTPTGECLIMCEDYRRIICKDGEQPETTGCIQLQDVTKESILGACCITDNDCFSDSEVLTTNINNRCIDDGNSRGAYCNKVGEGACGNDMDCNDPYPYAVDEGSSQNYMCLNYYDTVKSSEISFCERTKETCGFSRSKSVGEYCNEACGDSDCIYGTHCVDGLCTLDCGLDADSCPSVHSGKQLLCQNYLTEKTYPGYPEKISAKLCRNTCMNNADCKHSGNECNQHYNKVDANNNLPLYSTCGNKKTGLASKAFCQEDNECSSGLCVNNFCSEPCSTHEDCTSNGFCDYDKALQQNGQTVNYMGVCRYVSTSTSVKNSCSSSSECPPELVTVAGFDRNYKCLQYTDNTDTVRGICGIEKLIPGAILVKEAKTCFLQNKYCETGLCISENFNINSEAGKCREYCSETSDCSAITIDGVPTNQICKRIKFRDGASETGNNRGAYGGVCIPVPVSSLSDCSIMACAPTETCVLNPVNSYAHPEQPWKFSVEYLCVAKNPAGNTLGATCASDLDCQSNLCSISTNKCVSACTDNSQCSSGLTCNTSYPAIADDNNPSNWVLGGVCE